MIYFKNLIKLSKFNTNQHLSEPHGNLPHYHNFYRIYCLHYEPWNPLISYDAFDFLREPHGICGDDDDGDSFHHRHRSCLFYDDDDGFHDNDDHREFCVDHAWIFPRFPKCSKRRLLKLQSGGKNKLINKKYRH